MDKSGKRNRFLDALAGRNVQEEPEKFPEIPLKDMVQTLEGVTEEAWGRYAFAREPLELYVTGKRCVHCESKCLRTGMGEAHQ